MDNIPGQWQRLKNALSDFAVSSGLQNFTKNFLKDTADIFQAWSQWAQGNLTFKEALIYSGGNRDGREERIKIASRQGIRDVATRIGGVGKAIGLTQGDILGVSSAPIVTGD